MFYCLFTRFFHCFWTACDRSSCIHRSATIASFMTGNRWWVLVKYDSRSDDWHPVASEVQTSELAISEKPYIVSVARTSSGNLLREPQAGCWWREPLSNLVVASTECLFWMCYSLSLFDDISKLCQQYFRRLTLNAICQTAGLIDELLARLICQPMNRLARRSSLSSSWRINRRLNEFKRLYLMADCVSAARTGSQ